MAMLTIIPKYLLRGTSLSLCMSGLCGFNGSGFQTGNASTDGHSKSSIKFKLQLAPRHFGFCVPRYQHARREAPGIRRRLHDCYTMEIGKINLAPKGFI